MKSKIRVLKLGGAVITDKSKGVFNSPKIGVIDEICKVIANSSNLILVHGVGSFGHPYVEKYNLKEFENLKGVLKTHMACKELNKILCEHLMKYNAIPFPIHPFSSFKIGKKLIFDIDFIFKPIVKGMIPVIHGDFAFNIINSKFEVLSGDKIVIELAKQLDIKEIGFATDVDGIILNNKVIKEISNVQEILNKVSTAEEKSDVTGGMKGKILSLMELKNKKVCVFKGTAKNISAFLNGKDVGTRIIL